MDEVDPDEGPKTCSADCCANLKLDRNGCLLMRYHTFHFFFIFSLLLCFHEIGIK